MNAKQAITVASVEKESQDKGSKFLALLLTLGGVLGMGLSVYLGYTFVQRHWVYVVLAVAFLSLFVWTTLTGIRLWRNDSRGWKWGKILFAAQIPVLTVPGFSYEYYSGIAIKVLGGRVDSNYSMELGANANLYLDTRITDLVYGINLFAIGALIYLMAKSKPDIAPDPDAQSWRAG